jgi:hypothetical protein
MRRGRPEAASVKIKQTGGVSGSRSGSARGNESGQHFTDENPQPLGAPDQGRRFGGMCPSTIGGDLPSALRRSVVVEAGAGETDVGCRHLLILTLSARRMVNDPTPPEQQRVSSGHTQHCCKSWCNSGQTLSSRPTRFVGCPDTGYRLRRSTTVAYSFPIRKSPVIASPTALRIPSGPAATPRTL